MELLSQDEQLNLEYFFYTKGDYNKDPDNFVVEQDMLYGTVKFKIPLQNITGYKLSFFFHYKGTQVEFFPTYGLFTRIPPVRNSYLILGKYILKLIERRLTVFRYNLVLHYKCEVRYLSTLKSLGKMTIDEIAATTGLSSKEIEPL